MVRNAFMVLGIVMLALLLSPSTPAIAQEEGNTDGDVSEAGLLPDSNFYFFKVLGRNLQLWLSDNSQKANLQLQFADEDTAAVNELALKNNFQLAVQHSEQVQQQLQLAVQYMERAREQGQDVRVLVMKLEQNHLRQQAVLASVLEKAPEAAKEGLLNAIENSSKNVGAAIGEIEGVEAQNRYEEKLNQQVSNMGEDTKLRIKVRLQASHGNSAQAMSEEANGSTADSGQGQIIQQVAHQVVSSVSDNSQQNLQGYQHAGSGQEPKQPKMLQQVSQPGNQEVEVQSNSSGKGNQQKGGK